MKRSFRKHYFIDKELQGRYIFAFFLFLFLGSLFFAALLHFFSGNTLSIVYENNSLQIGKTSSVLFDRLLLAHYAFLLLGGGVVMAIALFLTHRMAGPLRKIEATLDNMVQGDFSARIVLRKRDEAKSLADKVNTLSASLEKTFSEISRLADEMNPLVQRMTPADLATAKSGEEEGRKAADRLQVLLGEMQDLLKGFRD